MYKVDKIKSLLDWDQCNQLLVDPVTLPCGNSICKIHLDKLYSRKHKSQGEKIFECELCYEEHSIPKKATYLANDYRLRWRYNWTLWNSIQYLMSVKKW